MPAGRLPRLLSFSIVLVPLEREGRHFILSYCLIALNLISGEVFVVDSPVFVQLVFSRILHIRPHGRRQLLKGLSTLSLILIHLVSSLPPCLLSLILGLCFGFGGSFGSGPRDILVSVVCERLGFLMIDALIRSLDALASRPVSH